MRSTILIFTTVLFLLGSQAWAADALLSGLVKKTVLMYSDSAANSDRLGQLEEGAKLTLFPEMSSDEYFFAMAETGQLAETYGWVPTKAVQLTDRKFGDVPQNHWAGEALRRLESEGIIEGDQVGFNGDRAVTRYELAMVLDRHLDKLKEYKGNIMAAIEAVPYDRTLDSVEAGKLDRLIQHLEGVEMTEKKLSVQVSDMRQQVASNSTRIDVVEELSLQQGKVLDKVETQMASLNKKVGRVDSFSRRMSVIEHQLKSLERRGFVPTTPKTPSLELKKLQDEMNELKERIKEVETANQFAMKQAEKKTEEVKEMAEEEADEDEFDISAEDFEMVEEEDEAPALEPAPDKLKRKAEQAHDALRAALRKGLIIRRHPMEDAQQKKSKKPNQVLVKALTKQISDISSSLQNIDSRINEIEHGMLD